MHQLQIETTEETGTFVLSGSITAETDFTLLLEATPSHLIFRFARINEITSVGVKKWVEGIRALRKSDKTVEYQNCPEIFVEQCNLVPEITQDVSIHSFEMTFICEDCDEEELKMLKTKALDLKTLPPSIQCPSCQEEMITEEDDAFRFILN